MTTAPSRPQRIQRSRAKGWRMPEGAVVVSRPSRRGNPWVAEEVDGAWRCRDTRGGQIVPARDRADAHDLAVAHFQAWLDADAANAEAVRAELRGKSLCCWCPPGLACHADVLIEIANA
jgi:hypothetical protein